MVCVVALPRNVLASEKERADRLSFRHGVEDRIHICFFLYSDYPSRAFCVLVESALLFLTFKRIKAL